MDETGLLNRAMPTHCRINDYGHSASLFTSRDKQRLDSDRGSKGDTMDDSRSLRGCSELTLFARFLKKFVLRTPRWQNRNTDQRLVRIGLQI